MSYILDALKRADADRERGHVPGLHSQAGGEPGRSATGRRLNAAVAARWSSRKGWTVGWLVLVAGLLAVAALFWRTSADPHPPSSDTPRPVDMAAAAPPTSAAPATGMPAAPPPALTATDEPRAATSVGPVLPILAPPEPPAAPVNRSVSATATRQTTPPAIEETPPASAAALAPAAAASAPAGRAGGAPAAAPVPRFADLPPETRAQLPAVSISGSTYSQNPAHRMLIANGKVVQEGSEVAPGLKLETIGPRSAVLNHQGTRYSIGY